VFQALPLAHLVQDEVFIVHGGLFQTDGVTLKDIEAVNRFREPGDEGIMTDILWSDPQGAPGRAKSKRGVGVTFGEDVTSKFLEQNNLSLVRGYTKNNLMSRASSWSRII
jgi:serine/threonine-protein phosphatase 5